MATLELNQSKLLKMAQDDKVSTEYWAKVMTDSKPSRGFFNASMNAFQSHRYWVEMGVKAAVAVTLGLGLFLALPATLLYGAAVALTLSSLIFANISLNKHEITVPDLESFKKPDNFNADAWESYRAKWTMNAQNHGLSENQRALHVNMTRIGLSLVIAFAAFTAIASGAAVPIAISSVLFAGSLFHRNIDEPAPYVEEEALPTLSR